MAGENQAGQAHETFGPWLVRWQANGGGARLSENDRRLVEGWLAEGADPNALLPNGQRPLVASLPSPELCELLIAHGAVPGQAFVDAVAQRCIGWARTPISSSQRLARMEEQAQWRKFVIAQMERWPELDWYAPCAWQRPDPRPRGLRKAMGTAQAPRHSCVPCARVIEHHIPGFTGRLENARMCRGVAPGPCWSTQQQKNDALMDLLAITPELHSFSGRDRATQVRDVLDQGAALDQLAGQAVSEALTLGQVEVLAVLFERIGALPACSAQTLADKLASLASHSGSRQAQMDCWQSLIERAGVVDWTQMVAADEGRMVLGLLVDKRLDGLYSKVQAQAMDAKTRPGKRSTRPPPRL